MAAPKKLRNVPPPKRTKRVDSWNQIHLKKVHDDLTRMLYYTFRGYEGPHPWGVVGRPPYPEYKPLRVVDKDADPAYVDAIQQYLLHPKVKQRWLRILAELRMLLRQVDPKNPRLQRRPISIARTRVDASRTRR